MGPNAVKIIKRNKPAKQYCVFIVTGLLTVWTPLSHADTLLDLWKIAESQDTKYLSAYHKYQSDQEVVNLSRADLLPTVSFQYEYKSSDQTINDSDNKVFESGSATYPTKSYNLSVTQSIFDYARWQRYFESEISVNRAVVDYSLAKQQLLLRLSESYFLVLERGDQLETIQSEKAAMLKYYETSEKRHKSGLGRTVDVEDAKARYLNALSKEVELENRLLDSRYALRESLGSMPGTLSKLRADITLELPLPADPKKWVEMAAQNNLELHTINLSLEEADKEIKALRGGHYPTLDLIYTWGNTVTDGSVYGGGSDVDNADLRLQVNVPLFSGGKTSAKVRQAIEKRNSVFEDRNDKIRTVERSTNDAYYRISGAIVQIGALEQSVQAQKSLLKSTTAGYHSGKNSLIQILDVEQDFSRAKQALVKARYDYVLNVLRLKFSAGGLQEEDLVAINSWLVLENPQPM